MKPVSTWLNSRRAAFALPWMSRLGSTNSPTAPTNDAISGTAIGNRNPNTLNSVDSSGGATSPMAARISFSP